MSLETVLKTLVGDGLPAVKATATITCTDSALAPLDTLTVNFPASLETAPVVFTQGTDFNGGAGNDALAEEIRVLINAINGLTATRLLNVVTIEVDLAGAQGDEYDFDYTGIAFGATAFINGKDLDSPVELEMTIDTDNVLTVKVSEEIVFRVPYTTNFSDNSQTFQTDLQAFVRKYLC